jgi:glycosyltransferase involved in cell wall biosynthesis
MVHILMISAEYSPHPPVPTRVTTLARIFARQGHRVILLSNSGRLVKDGLLSSLVKNLVPTKTEVDGVTWLFAPVIRSSTARGFLKGLEGFLSAVSVLLFGILLLPIEANVDAIYSSTAQSQGLVASFLKAVLDRPLVVNYGDPAFVRDSGIIRRVERLFEKIAISRSNLVVATDPVVAKWVSNEYRRKVILLPNGYDADLFRQGADYEGSPKMRVITFVGKVDLTIYRLDILVDALRILRERFSTVKLRVIGAGPDIMQLRLLARCLGVEESVEFLGHVAHECIPRLLAGSEVCVHITNDMCTGIKVAEYMAARKPVVIAAPWWNRYDQLLDNGVNCVMVPLVADELAAVIANMLDFPSAADAIAANGFKTVVPWTWENIAQSKMAMIAQLTKKRSGGRP